MKSMEIQSGHSELSVISQVSAVEGCPLSGVPLYVLVLLQPIVAILIYCRVVSPAVPCLFE